jgi:hypothetical protein
MNLQSNGMPDHFTQARIVSQVKATATAFSIVAMIQDVEMGAPTQIKGFGPTGPQWSFGGRKITSHNDSGITEDEPVPASQGKHRSERCWKLARRGRLRGKGYVCGTRPPFQDLSRDLFPGGVSPHTQPQQVERTSEALLPASRRGVLACTTRFNRPTGRCPVKPRPRWGLTK